MYLFNVGILLDFLSATVFASASDSSIMNEECFAISRTNFGILFLYQKHFIHLMNKGDTPCWYDVKWFNLICSVDDYGHSCCGAVGVAFPV